jgi:hypothetical protein
MKLKLKARVNRSDARTIRHALAQLPAKGSVRKAGDESSSSKSGTIAPVTSLYTIFRADPVSKRSKPSPTALAWFSHFSNPSWRQARIAPTKAYARPESMASLGARTTEKQ